MHDAAFTLASMSRRSVSGVTSSSFSFDFIHHTQRERAMASIGKICSKVSFFNARAPRSCSVYVVPFDI